MNKNKSQEKFLTEKQLILYRKLSSKENIDAHSAKKTIFLIENKYYIIGKIGGGSFGTIYKATNYESKENLAIKLEEIDNRENLPYLNQEAKILKEMTNQKKEGFAKFYTSGKIDNKFYIVMSLLGQNLEILKNKCGNSFSLPTVLWLAKTFLLRISNLHENNYLHRDIKPENFVIGKGDKISKVYLIDFGLAKCFKINDNEHIPFKKNKGLVGTVRYTSINSHLGYEQSRRDDLESIGYLLVYFLNGSLPWQGSGIRDKSERQKFILNLKKEFISTFFSKKLPKEIISYFKYVKDLGFEEKPDYSYLLNLFENNINFEPDWLKKKDFYIKKSETMEEFPLRKEKKIKTMMPPLNKKINECLYQPKQFFQPNYSLYGKIINYKRSSITKKKDVSCFDNHSSNEKSLECGDLNEIKDNDLLSMKLNQKYFQSGINEKIKKIV